MADDHIVNIIVNAVAKGVRDALGDVQGLEKGLNSLKKTSEDTAKSQEHLDDSQLSFANNLRKSRADIERDIAIRQTRIKKLNDEAAAIRGVTNESKTHIAQLAKQSQEEGTLISQSQKRLRAIQDEAKQQGISLDRTSSKVSGFRGSMLRLTRTTNDNTSAVGRFRKAWQQAGRDLERDRGIFARFAQTGREAQQDFDRLFRTLRGAAFAGIIASIQPLLSIITALVGQVIALGGSLVYVGGALGGAFVAGIAQAIPVVGIFLGVIQRLSSVMDAVNQHFLVQKQAANESSSAMEAQRNASNAVADAERGVADAQRGVIEANNQVADAQQALNDARVEAKDQVLDLMYAEKDEALALEDSILSRKEAQQQLQDAIASGASPLEIERLQLELKQANQDVIEQRTAAQRASRDANEARNKGVKSIDSYVAAQQALVDANKGVADAQRQLADANRRLAESHHDAATAAQDQSSAESYLKYFVDQLTPAEKELYHSIIRIKNFLKTQFTDVTDPIISAFSTGVDRGLSFLKDPKIFGPLKQLGQDLGDAFNELTKFATNPAMVKFFNFIIGETRRNLPEVVKLFEVLGRIFRNIATAAAPVLNKFLRFIVEQLREFNKLVSDKKSMEDFFKTGFRFFKAWFEVLKGVLDLAGALMGASKHSAFKTLTSFAETLHGAADDIRENGKEARDFFDKTAETLADVGDLVVALGEGMLKVFDVTSVKDFTEIIENFFIPALVEGVKLTGLLIKLFSFILKIPLAGKMLVFAAAFTIAYKSAQIFFGLIIGKFYQLGKAIASVKLGQTISSLKLTGGGLAAVGEEGVIATASFATMGVVLGYVIAGAAILVATFFALKNNWLGITDAIKGAGLSIWHDLTSAFTDMKDAVTELVDAVSGGHASEIFHALGEAFQFVGKYIAPVAEFLGKLLIVQVIARMLLPLIISFKAFSLGLRFAAFILHKLVSGFLDLVNIFKTGLKWIWDHSLNKLIFDALTGPFHDALEWIKGVPDKILGFFSGLGSLFFDAGSKIGSAISDGIQDAFGGVIGFFEDRINNVIDALNFAIDAFNQINPGSDIDPILHVGEAEEQLKAVTAAAKDAAQVNKTVGSVIKDVGDKVEKQGKQVEKNKKQQDNLNKTLDVGKKRQKDFSKETEGTTKELDQQEKGSRKTNRQLGNLIDTLFGTGKQSENLGDAIKNVTNKILKSFGVKELNFSIGKVAKKVGGALGTAGSLLGGIFQSGGYFGSPGLRGPDDRLVSVAGGEAMLTGWHQKAANAAMGIASQVSGFPYRSLGDMFSKDKRQHRTSPQGYEKGGIIEQALGPYDIPPIQYDPNHAGGNSHLHLDFFTIAQALGFGHKMQQMGWTVGEYTPKSGNPYGFGPITTTHASPGHYDGTAFDANTAEDETKSQVSIIAKMLGGSGAGAALAERISRILIKGPDGPLKDALQGQSDKLRNVANKFITEHLPQAGLRGIVPNVPTGPIQQMAKTLINKIWGASQWNPFALLEESEAGWDPTVVNTSSGAAGLAQALPASKYPAGAWPYTGLRSAKLQLQWMMGYIKERYGDPARAWAFHQANNWYEKGGKVPKFDLGGIVPGPIGMPQIAEVHGGETILPTHKFQSGGIVGNIHDQFKDVGKILKGTRGSNHIEKALNGLEQLLHDGGLLDQISETIDRYIAMLSTSATRWAYKVRHHIVTQVRTDLGIAEHNLDHLEKIGSKLHREAREINKIMESTERKLRHTDNKDQRKKLRAQLENLKGRANAVGEAVAQNITDQFAAQEEIIQAIMDRFDSRLSRNDLLQQILQARADISGKFNVGGQKTLLNRRGNILEDQRKELQDELRSARRRGDREEVRALKQSLLENRLALLENTKAVKDLEGSTNKIVDFNSSAWELWRMAIFNGQGGIMPHFSIPSLASGGQVVRSGLVNLHAGEVVTNPERGNGKIDINITEPMEVADPIALSNAIGFKLKTAKAVSR